MQTHLNIASPIFRIDNRCSLRRIERSKPGSVNPKSRELAFAYLSRITLDSKVEKSSTRLDGVASTDSRTEREVTVHQVWVYVYLIAGVQRGTRRSICSGEVNGDARRCSGVGDIGQVTGERGEGGRMGFTTLPGCLASLEYGLRVRR